MVQYNFKKMPVVPNRKDFIDIILSRTQRQTPTVVHKGSAISSLRKFYMRKSNIPNRIFMRSSLQSLMGFPGWMMCTHSMVTSFMFSTTKTTTSLHLVKSILQGTLLERFLMIM
ncbi:hypothetical protein L3X38_009164 [Prunus dulcis]|uniref:NOG1 N-terminal helical domain-containing protein n=1 Tax=Prunus dulcis TaxID=3755 RepID=A0AAD5F7Q3_PRUDU|nr:hypothetical protein L3X38_009164 [Prunus dulcis]